jgi:endo-1,4-beta-xylanase
MLFLALFAAGALAACSLPSSYNWTSSGPLASPIPDYVSLRDFSHANYKGQNLVYATTQDEHQTWETVAIGPFGDWSEMKTAKQTLLPEPAVAPSLFLFRPKNLWVLAYQWGLPTFSYKTSTDPTNVNAWSAERPLFTGSITNTSSGPLDVALIGDSKKMHLFFAAMNGAVYRASMPLKDFPGSFGAAATKVIQDRQELVFQGVQVYTISDNNYLLMAEAIGRGGRYYRSFTATSLEGEWTPQASTEANPFAGRANIGPSWSTDVGHGELIRSNPDHTMAVDPCKLQFLFQGNNPNPPVYIPIGYRPALLTQV